MEAELAREYIAKKVGASLGHIVDSLIGKARDGDVRAAQVLFERAYGRVGGGAATDSSMSVPFKIIIHPPSLDGSPAHSATLPRLGLASRVQ
jgi:hypothetical protein